MGLYLVDVSGHGVVAALLAVTLNHVLSPVPSQHSLLRQHIEGSTYQPLPSTEVAKELNKEFPMDPRAVQYFTLLYGILSLETSEFCFVCAGHPGPVYLSCAGEPVIVEAKGFPIGLFKDVDYDTHSIHMKPGDRLYLYSDGITETTNTEGEQFGEQHLIRAIGQSRAKPLKDSLSLLLRSVDEWRGGARLEDDVSVLAVEIIQ